MQKIAITANPAPELDAKKIWKDFTRVTTNRPGKRDIPTLRYKVSAKGVTVNWGDYSHLGACTFNDTYFMTLGTNREGFIAWLEAQGVQPDASKPVRRPKERPLYD